MWNNWRIANYVGNFSNLREWRSFPKYKLTKLKVEECKKEFDMLNRKMMIDMHVDKIIQVSEVNIVLK